MRQVFFFTIAVAVVAFWGKSANSDEPDTKPITIPLKDIWAWQMPGTKDVRTLEPRIFGEEAKKLPSVERERLDQESLVNQIVERLNKKPEGRQIGQAFAVGGTGIDALRETHAVLVLDKKPREEFPTESEITIVFFSSLSVQYVQLHDVRFTKNNVIELHYRFVPHDTKELTTHFALIPLGKLRDGKFDVKIIQSPMQSECVKAGFTAVTAKQAERIVCGPFSFTITDRERKHEQEDYRWPRH